MANGNQPFVQFKNVQKTYDGEILVVKDLNLDIENGEFLTMLGPSGSGKTTCLMMLAGFETPTQGQIMLGGTELNNVPPHKRGIGMVFQKPNPFPKSIYDNVAYGPRIHGLVNSRDELDEIVMTSLERAGLLKEVKDRLQSPATGLSGGQQQRLCIARAVAVSPEVILMDEPCSALDPIATAKVEELIDELRSNYTIVIVTHSMQQAARVSQRTAFFHLGKLVEVGETDQIFTNPKDERTKGYITGRFG